MLTGSQSGFENGRRVPIARPIHSEESADEQDERKIRQETIMRLFSRLIETGDPELVGRKVMVLAYLLQCDGAPKSLGELGKRLGISKSRAFQIVQKLHGDQCGFTGVFS